jgi:sirohydrochlorin cobaltochelatase/precorrin-2/cobalt-factor-2 C20-methyltransferase
MKSGSHLTEIKEKLIPLEENDKIIVNAVIDCGMETEQIFTSAMSLPDDSKYMMTIIVKEKI